MIQRTRCWTYLSIERRALQSNIQFFDQVKASHRPSSITSRAQSRPIQSGSYANLDESTDGRRDGPTSPKSLFTFPQKIDISKFHRTKLADDFFPRVRSGEPLRFRQTSHTLIDVLGAVGEDYERPLEDTNRLDFSDRDAASSAADRQRASTDAKQREREVTSCKRNFSPKDVLIDYLQEVKPHLLAETEESSGDGKLKGRQLRRALIRFHQQHGTWLSKRNWDITDIMTWSWIVTAASAERSALRLLHAYRRHPDGGLADIPQFVSVFLLRRQGMSARGLQGLLTYFWAYMHRLHLRQPGKKGVFIESASIPNPKDDLVGMQGFMFMVIIIRLLRMARKVWPESMLNIATFFCRFMDGVNFYEQRELEKVGKSNERSAAITFMYNKVLKLLALPISLHPVESSKFQRDAQYIVLRRMNQFKPPLVVSREGYRAMTTSHLLRQKSDDERKWASLKSSFWPPWRQEKLGIDADVGPEYGKGLAAAVMSQSKYAGYSVDHWDAAAKVLSGWDTDNSPTIQSRVTIRQRGSTPKRRGASLDHSSQLWESRIRATRTLGEAWGAFCSWKDLDLSEDGQIVYLAMLEKLYTKVRATDKEIEHGSEVESEDLDIAGDHLELFRPADTQRTSLAFRNTIPTPDELFEDMVRSGIKPNVRIWHLMIRKSLDVSSLIKYMSVSGLFKTSVISENADDLSSAIKSQLIAHGEKERLGAAVAQSLATIGRTWKPQIQETYETPTHQILLTTNPLKVALDTAISTSLTDNRVWYDILVGVARAEHSIALPGKIENSLGWTHPALVNWDTARSIVEIMKSRQIPLDLWIHKTLCVNLARAAFAAGDVLYRRKGIHNVPLEQVPCMEDVMSQATKMLKQLFNSIVLPSTTSSEMQINSNSTDHSMPPSVPLMAVPNYAQLHAYIRAVGLTRDFNTLLEIARFMHTHSFRLTSWGDEFPHVRHLSSKRKCIAALRVYTERSWRPFLDLKQDAGRLPSAGAGMMPKYVRRQLRWLDDWHSGSRDAGENVVLGTGLCAGAPREVTEEMEWIFEEAEGMQGDWGGWASDDEVMLY